MRKALWVAAVGLIVAGLILYLSPPESAASRRKSDRESVTSAAERDAALYSSGNYASVYRRLSKADKSRISEQAWVERCETVEAAVGKLETYEVQSMRYLDSDKRIVEVTLKTEWSKAPGPQVTTTYYVPEGSRHVQSMMWGREVVVQPSEVP